MKLKSKSKATAKWKPVEITGSLLNPSEDLGGFVGLEVLENYDSSFLTGNKKQKVSSLDYGKNR
jgi:hypothetical protein